MDFFVRNLRSIWGVCPTRRGVSHETEANRANLSLVVDCFRGEIHQSREAGPPERPQSEARRPLAQSRPPTAPQKKSRPSQTQFFIPLCLPNDTSTDQVTTSLRSSIAVSPSLLTAWGFEAAPVHRRDPKSYSLSAGAGKNNLLVAATLRVGRVPSLASLAANGCFFTFVRIRILEHNTPFLDRTQSRIFHELRLNYYD